MLTTKRILHLSRGLICLMLADEILYYRKNKKSGSMKGKSREFPLQIHRRVLQIFFSKILKLQLLCYTTTAANKNIPVNQQQLMPSASSYRRRRY